MNFRIFYQENMTLAEVARHRPPIGGAPDTEVDQKIFTCRDIRLKFRVSYQENMTLEEVARDRPPTSGAPDTGVLQVILKEVYLVNEKE